MPCRATRETVVDNLGLDRSGMVSSYYVRNEEEGEQTEVVLTFHEKRPRVCRKKGDENVVTGKEEKKETEEKIFACSERGYGESWCEGEGHWKLDVVE